MRHGPSIQEQPFDIDLLCAKLEVAKLEQDAARRRRHRQSAELPSLTENHRHSMIIPGAESRFQAPHIQDTKKRSPSDLKKTKHLFAALNVGKSRSEAVRDSAYFDALNFDTAQHIDSRRSSAGDYDAVPPHFRDTSNRQSVDMAANLDSSPKDTAKRRSRTFPLFSRITPKSRPMSSYGNLYAPDRNSSYDESPASPMGLVNEYTISYDLADIIKEEHTQKPRRTIEKRRESFEKPLWASGTRSRSLLNLNALLKKDRTEVRTEEVVVLDDIPEHEHGRPLTSANGYHTRQKSLPIDLNKEINMSGPILRNTERERKRSSFVAFFKKLS